MYGNWRMNSLRGEKHQKPRNTSTECILIELPTSMGSQLQYSKGETPGQPGQCRPILRAYHRGTKNTAHNPYLAACLPDFPCISRFVMAICFICTEDGTRPTRNSNGYILLSRCVSVPHFKLIGDNLQLGKFLRFCVIFSSSRHVLESKQWLKICKAGGGRRDVIPGLKSRFGVIEYWVDNA